MGKGRKLTALMAALVLMLLCAGVTAESGSPSPAARSATVAELLKVPDFKFFVKNDGIGTGSAPVYTAPSTDSIRLSDGKASCSVASDISVAGHVNGWLLVRYNIGRKDEKDREARVGYIPPEYSRKYKSDRGDMEFVSIPVTLAADAEITDNPRKNHRFFGTLGEGTTVTILAKYTYTLNWWYVEAELDGKLTRGFIDRGTAALLIDGEVYTGNEALGYPAASPDSNPQAGMVTVTGKEGEAMILRKRADHDSPMVARLYVGESFPCYGIQTLKNGKTWYYLWVDGVWGWLSGTYSAFSESN